MTAILRAVAVTAWGGPTRALMGREKNPNADLSLPRGAGAIRKAAAARLELRRVLLDRTLRFEVRVPGHRASHEVKCFSVFQGLISKPTSPARVSRVSAPSPEILKRSTPVSLNNWVRISTP